MAAVHVQDRAETRRRRRVRVVVTGPPVGWAPLGLSRGTLRRWTSPNVPITAVGMVLYGLVFIAAPREYSTERWLNGPFVLVHRPVWAAVFIAAGLLALIVPRLWSAWFLSLVVTGWLFSILWALWSTPGWTPGSWLPFSVIAAMLWVSVWRGAKSDAPGRRQVR